MQLRELEMRPPAVGAALFINWARKQSLGKG